MTYVYTKTIAALAVLSMAACGGSGGGDTTVDPPMPSPDIIAPTITAGNILARRDLYNAALTNQLTGTLPIRGTLEYRGHYEGALSGSTPNADSLQGTLVFQADTNLAGDDFTGSIRNLHVAKDGVPVEKLVGEISFSGTASDAGTAASALTGTVRGQINEADLADWDVAGNLNGAFRDVQTGTNIFGAPTYDRAGAITGTGNISLTSGPARTTATGSWYALEQ